MKNLLLATLILFSTYAIGQSSSIEVPKIGIKVPLGKTLEANGVSVKFLEVVEDSRCPKDVSCIWAGRAIVKAEVTSNGKTEEKILIFGEVKSRETPNTTLFNSKEFSLKGITLNPYPDSVISEDVNYVLLVSKESY
ncbi:MAG TPA: hypothetical protein VKX34_03680 [Aequorivita sp.]|nr:hypothetical protein [Aequorivita sp.]